MAAAVFAVYCWPAAAAAERPVIGYIEGVRVYPGDAHFEAKIDSGADNSSIDVGPVEEFQRDGGNWVRFTLTDDDGRKVSVERPVARITTIRRSGTGSQKRYVVDMGVCLGGHFKEAPVNLNHRPGMKYKMLIGRSFLGDAFFIDASSKNLTKPECPGAPRP